MKHLIKSLLDKVMAIILLIALSPLLIVLCILVYFNLGAPIFFKQKRPGLHGKIFTIYKFRTMREETGHTGRPLDDKARITRFGMMLRSTSLDELPELFNVIKGDMSFVGPRPLLVEYLERYTSEQARRHEVKPGITGWAQVNGRNAISWEEKFRLDVWYVDNQSMWLDIKILLMTVLKVFKREGISQQGHVTIGEFKGYSDNGVEM